MASWQAHALKTYLKIRKRFSDNSGELDIAKERAEIESMATMFKPIGKIQWKSVIANGIPAEWITPLEIHPGRAILYLHGGSFNSGSITSHRTLAGNMAIASKASVLLIDYRLAPENPFPAAEEDTLTAYEWLLTQGIAPSQIIVAGDSAGGTLTLTLLIHLRDHNLPMPAAAVCLSPAPDLAFSGDSWVYNSKKDLIIDQRKELKAREIFLRGVDPCSPDVSPIFADLKGLPPVLMQVGSDEVLLSDVERFAQKARECGVDLTLEVWPGMQHEWQFAARVLPEGRQAIYQVGQFVEAILGKPASTPNVAG